MYETRSDLIDLIKEAEKQNRNTNILYYAIFQVCSMSDLEKILDILKSE